VGVLSAPHPAARGGRRPSDVAEQLRHFLRFEGSPTAANMALPGILAKAPQRTKELRVARQENVRQAQQRPPAGSRHLLIPLAQSKLRPKCRYWTGNDEKGHYTHHGAVPLSDSPIDMRLAWRRSSSAPTRSIGCYRLDLVALLAGDYVRKDPKPGHIRLQFVHRAGSIYIQVRNDMPGLYVGSFSSV
jgi:hypothetical protein